MKRTPSHAPPALLGALFFVSSFAPLARTSARQQPPRRQAPAPQTPTTQQSPAPQQSPQPSAQPAASQPPVEIGDEDVVRITTNIVQLDAIVTDRRGNQVTDLKPEDFQIFEDGKPQRIAHFSYVSTDEPAAAATPAAAAKPDKNAPPAPPVPPRRLRPEQVRRAVAIVVDDLQLSVTDLYFARRGVREYVEKFVAPDDLVAVIRTSAGVGALQQFTNDRRVLYAAIDRIKPFYAGSGGLSTFAPVEPDPTRAGSLSGSTAGTDPSDRGSSTDSGREQRDDLESFREDYFTVGTLGALNYVVNGMRQLPGRKSVLLFSPGF
ncbi:MAG: VWA domain-containing protein, partial [Pyrinomonadaceae bacterium]